ncbi:MAG: YdcF family protein [Merismopedia sp. SIO2A8]|nr:YdcF family protein [Merismopedia sp. SIO2A8]
MGQGTTQARVLPDGQRQVQLTEKSDRILHTDRIFQQQRALGANPIIIVSAGPRPAWQGNGSQISEANDIAQVLTQLGVPQDRIVPEPFSLNMHSSAEQVKRILEERGLVNGRIFVVTSGINSRRSRLTFANVGLTVVPQPTDFQGSQLAARPETTVTAQPFLGSNFLPPIRVESFVPSVEALTVTTKVWEETLIRIYYILRGWTGQEPL